jgi:CRP/FNR family cyclic AMP-dependent transcriptional regulator
MTTKSNRDTVILERRFFPKDSVIINEGEEGDAAFLIQSGQVEIFKTIDEKRFVIAELGTGAIFGEMTLLFNHNRTASAYALEDCNLIIINRQTLNQKLAKSDPTIRAVIQALVKRLEISTTKWAENSLYVDFAEAVHDLFKRAMQTMPRENIPAFKKEAGPIVEDFIRVITKYNQDSDQ